MKISEKINMGLLSSKITSKIWLEKSEGDKGGVLGSSDDPK